MSRLALLAIPLAAAVVGCTHRVDLDLKPAYASELKTENELAAVRPALVFRRGTFTDKRGDTTMLTTWKEGVHTYNAHAKHPMPDLLFDGLRTLVTNAGHAWAEGDSADVRVDLQLLNVQAARNAGFINVGATGTVQIKVDFFDGRDRLVYGEVYNGSDEETQALIGFMGLVQRAIDHAIVMCVNSVGTDARLATALRRVKEPAQ